MTARERDVRAAVYAAFRHTGSAPSPDAVAVTLGLTRAEVTHALHGLADSHAIVLRRDGESIWMAHPFSGVRTDVLVAIGPRRWFANCVWDGLSIIGLLGGTGRVETHSPATQEPITLEVTGGRVAGRAVAHFLVPAARFWDDIAFT
jgi:hypothetical protein